MGTQDSDFPAANAQVGRELWQAGPPESEMRFTFRHFVFGEISGLVGRWRATILPDFDRPSRSSVQVIVDPASLDTANAERDDQIRSPEFLDVRSFPEIRFRSAAVRAGDREGRFLIAGHLTIRNVTNEVTVTADRQGANHAATGDALLFSAQATIDRQRFGLHWNQDLDRGGVVVGDKVDLRFRVEARRGAAAP